MCIRDSPFNTDYIGSYRRDLRPARRDCSNFFAMHQQAQLRPMSIGEIIDAAIAVYRRNFAPLFGIAAVVQVPLMALQLTAMHPITSAVLHSREGALRWQELAPSAGLLLVALVLAMLIGPLAEAALAVGVSERYLGRDIGVGRAYRAARGRWARVLWTSIIYWVLIYLFAGLALLVLVGPFLTYVLSAGGSEALRT